MSKSYSPDMFRTWRTVFAFVLAAALFPFGSIALSQIQPNGQPCDGDCMGALPACQNAWQPYVSTVFLGRATEVRKEDVPITLDGEKKLTEKLLVTFVVKEAFVGVSEKVLTVSSGGDMCAFPFSKGHEYLVYARRLSSGELYVSTCYGTNFAEYAANDLKYLRGLPDAPPGGTIYGTAFRFAEPMKAEFQLRRHAPETGREIQVKGITRSYETTVDGSGNFSVTGLPSGRYTVLLKTEGEVYTSPPVKSTTVEVADKGCARFNFWVDPYAFETTASRCPLPPEFPVVRVDRQSKRLFLQGSGESVASQAKIDSYLKKLDRAIDNCEPSWKTAWSVSFFSNPKLAGYKTDTALSEAVENGDWGNAYVAEYDRSTQVLTIFPVYPQKRQMRKVIVGR
jgi:hypothetical protein